MLLCQLFFLPAEHGSVGIQMLEDFFWLKKSANAMLPPGTIGELFSKIHYWQYRCLAVPGTVMTGSSRICPQNTLTVLSCEQS
jgi:hypothetical protein